MEFPSNIEELQMYFLKENGRVRIPGEGLKLYLILAQRSSLLMQLKVCPMLLQVILHQRNYKQRYQFIVIILNHRFN
jgi:hypothetical protein